jgi:hypothetical protein
MPYPINSSTSNRQLYGAVQKMSFHLKVILVIDASVTAVVAVLTCLKPNLVLGLFISNHLSSSINNSFFGDDNGNDNGNDDNYDDDQASNESGQEEANSAALSFLGPIFTITMLAFSVLMVVASIIGGKSARSKDRIIDVKAYEIENRTRIFAAMTQQRIIVAIFGSFLGEGQE